jgi:hypothetical protein
LMIKKHSASKASINISEPWPWEYLRIPSFHSCWSRLALKPQRRDQYIQSIFLSQLEECLTPTTPPILLYHLHRLRVHVSNTEDSG